MAVDRPNDGQSPPTDKTSVQALHVYLLGLVDFDSALALQHRFASEVAASGSEHGVLLLCEHPPVVTIGREGRHADALQAAEVLRSEAIAVRRVPRGGPTLLHMPGQLAVYLVVPLERRRMGLWEFGMLLRQTLVAAAAEQQVAAMPQDAPAGVVTRAGQVGWLGAAIRRGVSTHGAFLNVDPDVFLMREVLPPTDPRITSLAAARVHPVSMHAVRESVVRHVSQALQYTRVHVYTAHPALRRVKRSSAGDRAPVDRFPA